MGLVLRHLGIGFLTWSSLGLAQDPSWDNLWHALDRDLSPLARAELTADWELRLDVRAVRGDSNEEYRRQLARNALGLEQRALRPPQENYLGPPAEAWIAARFRPGLRVQLLAHGLRDPLLTSAQEQARLQQGYEVFLELEGAFDPNGELIAQALHSRAQATWSAFCLEGILRRLGKGEQALQVLAAQLLLVGRNGVAEREALLARRAILYGSMGQSQLARADLGTLITVGSRDAGQILGLGALQGGQWSVARGHFGVLLDRGRASEAPQAPWALRGYGVSLLPRTTSRGQD